MRAKWSIFGLLLMLLVSTSLVLVNTAQPAAAQEDVETCLQYPQLDVHHPVRVKAWPPLANFVRDAPGFEGDIIGRIPPGNPISLLPEGMPPVCADGIYWWYVEWEGVIGWTAEGDGQDQYWLENFYFPGTPTQVPPGTATSTPIAPPTQFPPVTATSTPIAPPTQFPPGTATSTPIVPPPTVVPPTITPTSIPAQCALPPRLTIGERGRVLPGPANLLRVSPNDLSWRSVIGRIPADGVFTVQAGPYCGEDGRLWWYVAYQGIQGWTAEGENGIYWLEPIQ